MMADNSLLIKIRERSAKIRNRYPNLFTELSEKFIFNGSILCYGCGQGQEVITINEYFPDHNIVGVDINENVLEKCKQNCGKMYNVGIYHVSEFIELNMTFDVVFCLNVFKRLKSEYTLQQFDNNLTDVSKFLSINGILVLDGIQYDFEDTETYKTQYELFTMECDGERTHKKHSFKHYCYRKIHEIR